MEKTSRVAGEEVQDALRDIGYEAGCAVLVSHDPEFISFRRQRQHRVGKVPSPDWAVRARRVEAAGADDEMPGGSCGSLLTGEFACTVLVDRPGGVGLCVGRLAVCITAKDIVGADLNQHRIDGIAGGCQLFDRGRIDQAAGSRLMLRCIDRRPGSAVDDHLRPQRLQDIPNHGGLRQVELLPRQRHGGRPQLPADLPAELPRRAGHGDRVWLHFHWGSSFLTQPRLQFR